MKKSTDRRDRISWGMHGDFEFEPGHEPVPKLFHSFETGEPFAKCSVCGRDVSGGEMPYMIEKAFQRGETIHEYAICQDCHAGIRAELSAESLARVENHLRSRLAGQVEQDAGFPGRCVLSGNSLGEEYVICGLFLGRSMVADFPPFAISGEEIEVLQEQLSKTTRDRLDDFTEDVLGIPGLGNPLALIH